MKEKKAEANGSWGCEYCFVSLPPYAGTHLLPELPSAACLSCRVDGIILNIMTYSEQCDNVLADTFTQEMNYVISTLYSTRRECQQSRAKLNRDLKLLHRY